MAAIDMLYHNVYNYYRGQYQSKGQTRFDAHKASELRKVYRAMVKTNQVAPFYKIDYTNENRAIAVELKESARGFKNMLSELTDSNTGRLFDRKAALSKNEDIVTVKYVGERNTEEMQGFSLEVEKLATHQQNQGDYLLAERLSIAPGTYSFDVNINDMDYEFQVGIGENDTNLGIQQKIANMVNKSNIGITATVEKNPEKENRARLCIQSQATGVPEGNRTYFHISDNRTGKKKGLVDFLGIEEVTQNPEDAMVRLDGVEYLSPTNTFVKGKEFEITLHKTSEPGEPVDVVFATDGEAVKRHIDTFVNEYNDFRQLLQNCGETQEASRKLSRDYTAVLQEYEPVLEKMGIMKNEDGGLFVDEKQLSAITKNRSAYEKNLEELAEFKKSLVRITNHTIIDPIDYIDKLIVSYKKPGGLVYLSPYTSSVYSGMLFNSYC